MSGEHLNSPMNRLTSHANSAFLDCYRRGLNQVQFCLYYQLRLHLDKFVSEAGGGEYKI